MPAACVTRARGSHSTGRRFSRVPRVTTAPRVLHIGKPGHGTSGTQHTHNVARSAGKGRVSGRQRRQWGKQPAFFLGTRRRGRGGFDCPTHARPYPFSPCPCFTRAGKMSVAKAAVDVERAPSGCLLCGVASACRVLVAAALARLPPPLTPSGGWRRRRRPCIGSRHRVRPWLHGRSRVAALQNRLDALHHSTHHIGNAECGGRG